MKNHWLNKKKEREPQNPLKYGTLVSTGNHFIGDGIIQWNTSTYDGEDIPQKPIKVDWGTPPVVTCTMTVESPGECRPIPTCTVTVQCPTRNVQPEYISDKIEMQIPPMINIIGVGIPSEIKLVAPMPSVIRFDNVNLPSTIGFGPIPDQIKITATSSI